MGVPHLLGIILGYAHPNTSQLSVDPECKQRKFPNSDGTRYCYHPVYLALWHQLTLVLLGAAIRTGSRADAHMVRRVGLLSPAVIVRIAVRMWRVLLLPARQGPRDRRQRVGLAAPAVRVIVGVSQVVRVAVIPGDALVKGRVVRAAESHG